MKMTTPTSNDAPPKVDADPERRYLRRVHAGINIFTGLSEKHIALVEPCRCDIKTLEVNEYRDVLPFCTATTLFEPLQQTPALDGRCHAGFDPESLEFFCHEIPESQKSCRCKYLPVEYDYDQCEVSEEDSYWGYIARLNAKVKKYNMEAVPRWFSKPYAQTLHPAVEGEMDLAFGPIAPSSYAQTFCTILVAIEGSVAEPIDLTDDNHVDDCDDEAVTTTQLGNYRQPPAPGYCRCRTCEGYATGGCLCGHCLGPCEVTGKFDVFSDDEGEYDGDKTEVGSPGLETALEDKDLVASME